MREELEINVEDVENEQTDRDSVREVEVGHRVVVHIEEKRRDLT